MCECISDYNTSPAGILRYTGIPVGSENNPELIQCKDFVVAVVFLILTDEL